MEGPINYLEHYLLDKNYTVYRIDHPLANYGTRETLVYKNSLVIKIFSRVNLSVLNLLIDFFLSIYYCSVLPGKNKTLIGANNFDTLAALTYKLFNKGNVRKIIYFAADYSENRYGNALLDWVYVIVEKLVLKYSDVVVSNTHRAEKKRISLGLNTKKSVVVPNGVYLDSPTFKNKKINNNNFIYIGNVTPEHGLLAMIRVLKDLNMSLTVIGGGSGWKELEKFVRKEGIYTKLYKDKPHSFVIDYLKDFKGWGLAPYNNDSLWTVYCSPLKVNEYIASGIPVVVSSVPEISKEISEKGLGVVYKNLNGEDLAKNISEFNSINFNLKAKSFYSYYNYNCLYSLISL